MSPDALSATFAALSDPTRRAILARLALGETTVSELAEPFAMSLPAVSKHLKVLERAGLITRGPRGAVAALPAGPGPAQGRRRAGWSITAGSGTRASIVSTPIWTSCKGREHRVAQSNSTVAEPADRVLSITRTFDAPRELVFKVWTQPEHLVRWWGPKGFTTPSCQMDVRPGGAYRTRDPLARGQGHLHARHLPRGRAARAAGDDLRLGGRGGPAGARDPGDGDLRGQAARPG